MSKLLLFLILFGFKSFAQAPTPPKVRGHIDPCKLQTMGPQHAAWKASNCS